MGLVLPVVLDCRRLLAVHLDQVVLSGLVDLEDHRLLVILGVRQGLVVRVLRVLLALLG